MASSFLLALGLPVQLEECRQKKMPEGWVWLAPDPQGLAQQLQAVAGVFIFDEAMAGHFPYHAVPQNIPVFVNHVQGTLSDFPAGAQVVRMNAWPGFFGSGLLELSASPASRASADVLLDKLRWPREWIPDVPGLVRPRVISMLVNEACFARGEAVSTAAEIDTAMKLGTNYPRGPFEWANLIGSERIIGLLQHLSTTDPGYAPAPGIAEILGNNA